MDNKYEAFLKGIENLKSENMKRECKSLITLAQRYYSKYDHYNRVLPVKNYLSKSYTVEDDKINVRQSKSNQLTPINELYLEAYLKIFDHDNLGGRKKYKMIHIYDVEIKAIIRDLERCSTGSSIPEMLKRSERYEHYTDQKCIELVKNTFKLMRISCKKASEKYKSTKVIDLKPGSAQETLKSYSWNLQHIEQPEEISFNKIFSDSYVETLLEAMNKQEAALPFLIAPVRAQLCYESEGGRDIDSKTWRWCFDKDFRDSIDKLDETTENIIEQYATLSKIFSIHKNKLETLSKVGILPHYCID